MSAIEALVGIFAERRIPWAVVGALAANVYRNEVRATADIDVLVSLGGADMSELADLMVRKGWAIRHMPKDGWLLRATHPEFGAVDVIAAGTAYQQIALARAELQSMPNGAEVKTLAVEDVLIHKLIANRAKDDADVESILAAQPKMDSTYLHKWIDEWDVGERYDRIVERMRASRK